MAHSKELEMTYMELGISSPIGTPSILLDTCKILSYTSFTDQCMSGQTLSGIDTCQCYAGHIPNKACFSMAA